jgi:hypothetical protein
MSNLLEFYKVLNTVELSSEDHKKISSAACDLANAEMRKGNEIALSVYKK